MENTIHSDQTQDIPVQDRGDTARPELSRHWSGSPFEIEELERICQSEFIPWEKLENKSILVTGATGLIGFTLIHALLYANERRNLHLKILALTRDDQYALDRFRHLDQPEDTLCFVRGSVRQLPPLPFVPDYFVLGASKTASTDFVRSPVETIETNVMGTQSLLQLAKEENVSGVVFLSSMEVYGYPQRGHKVTEDEIGAFSPLDLRNSYPLSKQLSESLCVAYAREYCVPAVILRLTQTYGPGMQYNDHRLFAQLLSCVEKKKDIVLHTKGETEHSYLYAADAVTAILTVLLKGTPGQAYNAADERTYCSIAELAQKVAKVGEIGVQYEPLDEKTTGYPKTVYMDLDTTKLKELGWRAGNADTLADLCRRIKGVRNQ